MRIEVFKEEMAWAIDKRLQFTISYYIIPLETCKEAIAISFSYPNYFSYQNTFENEKVCTQGVG